jgi:hypothetical protein
MKCKSPCKAIEEYIAQDTNDEQWLNIYFTDRIEVYEMESKETVSTTEVILQNYFIDRMSPKEIAEKHYKSQQYIYWLIKKYTVLIAKAIKQSCK